MKTIRFGTFETNSSSAHSLILVSKSDFEKFQKNEMVLQMGGFGVSDEYLESVAGSHLVVKMVNCLLGRKLVTNT
jgi:hypothetical protein